MNIKIVDKDVERSYTDPTGANHIFLKLSSTPDVVWVGFFFSQYQRDPNSYKGTALVMGNEIEIVFRYHVVQQVVNVAIAAVDGANHDYMRYLEEQKAQENRLSGELKRIEEKQKTANDDLKKQLNQLKFDK